MYVFLFACYLNFSILLTHVVWLSQTGIQFVEFLEFIKGSPNNYNHATSSYVAQYSICINIAIVFFPFSYSVFDEKVAKGCRYMGLFK